MEAQNIAELIILVADSTIEGRISLAKDSELNSALWHLAHKLGLEGKVDEIFQNSSMEEMKEAMKEAGIK